MSLAQALEHCERERERATDPRSDLALRHDLARLSLRAGQVDVAREHIASLLADAPPGSPLRNQLLTLNTQARYATPRRDGHRPAFDHPYYWAPFMLVGDWR
jgi:CHAT domain-containing protein